MNPTAINSTNSVSTTRRKREAERSVNWTAEETQVLLCAWSDERVQKSLAENLRNRHVFKHLSARMSEMGFTRSPHQCRLRVKTLKANYVRAKQQRSVDGAQPCTFKYFAEMDAVLGRRSALREGGHYFVPPEEMSGHHIDAAGRTGSTASDFSSEMSGSHFLGRTGREHLRSLEGVRPPWQIDSEVKLEDGEDSTDEFEITEISFPHRLRDKHSDVYLEASIHREPSGTPVENSLRSLSPLLIPPPPAPPSLHPPASPLPAAPDPPAGSTSNSFHPHPDSACLEPVLRHLSECFQRLVSETRGLLVELESQRREQTRWHQELLAQWLQREERRHREAAEREERREKVRMEHELRVLELLRSLTQQRPAEGEYGCRCRGRLTVSEVPNGPNHSITKDGN
ncbi:uncharacterized protein LOC117511191 isoform X2 [Thalassophryne amazonica]|uniref:uncharacterized protein LOC117511191 isoform X2 n=1 Tax=Thalassophryne amazonica TaxID=390379 RepID=UPI001471D3A5|nr:uncharacterized protein LOC117511191 isoform X2 [Thalassophryne amazonica]